MCSLGSHLTLPRSFSPLVSVAYPSERTDRVDDMSSRDNSEVAVEKSENDKSAADAKAEVKGTKRPAEVSTRRLFIPFDLSLFFSSFAAGTRLVP